VPEGISQTVIRHTVYHLLIGVFARMPHRWLTEPQILRFFTEAILRPEVAAHLRPNGLQSHDHVVGFLRTRLSLLVSAYLLIPDLEPGDQRYRVSHRMVERSREHYAEGDQIHELLDQLARELEAAPIAGAV